MIQLTNTQYSVHVAIDIHNLPNLIYKTFRIGFYVSHICPDFDGLTISVASVTDVMYM